MPASLFVRYLTVTRGALTCSADVDLTLSPGRCVGVIGPNGIGKSTLLRRSPAVDDRDHQRRGLRRACPDVGHRRLSARRSPIAGRDETVDAFLARRTGVADAQTALDEATTCHGRHRSSAGATIPTATRWNGGWRSVRPTSTPVPAQVFADLSVSDRLLGQPTATLSGGEAARVSLASMLLSQLRRRAARRADQRPRPRRPRPARTVGDLGLDAPVVLVSHDRAFLERTVTDVVEIDHHSRRGRVVRRRVDVRSSKNASSRRHRAQQRYDEYDSKRQSLVDRGQREREWASQGAAKVAKSGENDKHIRNFKMNQTEQLAGRAARTQRALERLDEGRRTTHGVGAALHDPDGRTQR